MNHVPQKINRLAALVCLVVFSATRLCAQSSTGNATLTVVLSDVLQLTINTSAVSLNFATAANYNNGVTSLINSQLTITCNKAYDLRIKTAGPTLINGANTIPVSNVTVQTVGLGGAAGGTPLVVSALSTTDQTLVRSLPPTMSQAINVQYSTAAGNTAFLKPAGAYVTTVTFTAIAN